MNLYMVKGVVNDDIDRWWFDNLEEAKEKYEELLMDDTIYDELYVAQLICDNAIMICGMMKTPILN